MGNEKGGEENWLALPHSYKDVVVEGSNPGPGLNLLTCIFSR